jgi:hypothetical protein
MLSLLFAADGNILDACAGESGYVDKHLSCMIIRYLIAPVRSMKQIA